MLWVYYSLLVFHNIIYFSSFFLVWKRKEYQEISIRSPFLLIMNNVGGYLMSLTFILYEIFKDFNNTQMNNYCITLPYQFFIFHMLMILSFYFRCQRVIKCCNLRTIEKEEEFMKKRYLYTERYYVEMLVKIMLCVIILIIVNNYFLGYKIGDAIIIIIPKHFKKCLNNSFDGDTFILYFWIILNFIECIIIINYTYFIYFSNINKTIKIELFFFFFLWVSNGNIIRLIELFINEVKSDYISILFVLITWLCLVSNTFIPIIYSLNKSSNFNLHLPPKLLNNFFIFMTNEVCFKEFLEYLKLQKESSLDLYLDFYIDILSMNFKINLNAENLQFENEIKHIHRKYIEGNDDLFTTEIKAKITNLCESKEFMELGLDVFDEALNFSFELLENKFLEFKNTERFLNLVQKFTFNSEIFCRMYNTGLIRNI